MTLSFWKIRIGRDEFEVDSVRTLVDWAKNGHLSADDRVLAPSGIRWMWPEEIPQLRQIFGVDPFVTCPSPDYSRGYRLRRPICACLLRRTPLSLLDVVFNYAFVAKASFDSHADASRPPRYGTPVNNPG